MTGKASRTTIGVAISVLALLAVGCSSSSGGASEGQLTFVSFGGALQEGGEVAYSEPFTAETGTRVISDGPTDYAKLRSMVEAGQVSWDVVEGDPFFAIQECGTLLEPIDTEIVDTSAMPAAFVSECSVPSIGVADVLLYDETAYDSAPQGWADLFDTEKFPGKRALWSDVYAGNLEIALLADGVAPEDLYPLDVDRAIAKWDTIKDDIVFWDSGAQSQQLMASQEVSMLWAWSGRAYDAIQNGAPFAAVWDQNLFVPNAWMVPKGSENVTAAMEFIAFATSAQAQTAIAELIPYAPTNADASPQLDELGMAFLPSAPAIQETQVSVDFSWWADNYEATQKLWDAWRIG